jgi:hypothetical protein
MPQTTLSPPRHRAQQQRLRAEALYGEEVPGTGALDERHLHPGRPSGSFLGVGYERFLQMPVPVVLTALWLAGAALLGSLVLMLYVVVTSVASVL